MSYSHRMSATFFFHAGVTKEQIKDAFRPLLNYWENLGDGMEFSLESNRKNKYGNEVYFLDIETWGEVFNSYDDLIKECAKNLTHLC